MTHIQRHASTTFRILSALAAVSLPMTIPSKGATADVTADVSMSRPGIDRASLDRRLATVVTGIEVKKDADVVSVTISGDGALSHEALRLGERRLVVDIPRVFSEIHRPTLNVGHRLVKQIRIGDHSDKVRIVFDLGQQAEYAVEPQGANLLVRVKEAAGGGSLPENAGTNPQMSGVQAAAADIPPTEVTPVAGHKVQPVMHRATPAFRVRPIQMMAEPEAAEKHTRKDDLVVGETRYVGRRIS